MLKEHTKLMFAADSKQALEMCSSNKNIDLLLCEVNMAGDINEFLKQLKAIKQDLTIIGIGDTKALTSDAKFKGFISKPFETPGILDELNKYLG